MRIALTIVLLLATLAPFISCKNGPPGPPRPPEILDNSDGLIPLRVGNEWIYQYYLYDTSGAVIATFLDTVKVKKDTVLGNERWYNAPRLKPADVDFLDFYTNRINGLWVRRRVIRPDWDTAFYYLTFKYPVDQGQFWGSQLGDSTRAISINEIVTTPSGVDTCIKYEDHFQLYAADGIIFYYYLRPNKGWVMFEIYSKTNSGRQYLLNRLVLVSANIRTSQTQSKGKEDDAQMK